MKVVIFGATGMVGQGVLRECLLDPDVESILAIVRKTSLPQQIKLREILHQDVSDLSAIEDRLDHARARGGVASTRICAARNKRKEDGEATAHSGRGWTYRKPVLASGRAMSCRRDMSATLNVIRVYD